jgi:hypothetical protein
MLDPSLTDEIRKAIQKLLKDAFVSGNKDGARYGRSFANGMNEALKDARQDVTDAFKQARADKELLDVMQKTSLKGALAEYARLLNQEGLLTDEVIRRLQKQQEELDHLNEQNELTRKVAEHTLEIREEAEKYKKGLEKILATTRAIGNDPKLFGAFMLTQAVEKSKEFVESFEKFHHLGLTAGQSIQAMTKSFSIMSAIGLADNAGVIEGMLESYGNLNALTKDEVNQVGSLAHKMGVTGQEAFELVDALSKMPGETTKTAIAAAKYTKHLATANGLAPGKLTKDMAKNTEAMALFSAKGAKGFAHAAVELHKMGVDITTASAMAKGLLNFEESITKQMEASVLLGREINLDKARELALNGDLEGATKEVLKNIGSQAEFDKMNVLQKQKLAEASGLTVEQLNKAMDAQQEYNKYHGEEASMWMNIVGYATDYGSKVVGFMKENGIAIMSTIQLLTTLGNLKIVQWAMDKAQWAWTKGVQAVKSLFAAKDIAATTAAAGAKQLEAIANTEVAASATAAAAAETSLTVATTSAGAAATGAGAGISGFFASMAAGLTALGQALAAPTPAGVPVIVILMGLGATLMMVGAGAMMMGLGIMFAAMGLVKLIGAFAGLTYDQIAKVALGMGILTASLYLLAPALTLITIGSGGLLALSVFLLSTGAAAMMFGAGIALSADKIGVFGENIQKLQIQEILKLGPALLLVAAGLAAMAYAGFGALPVLGALVALATVAPALVGLGNALGGMFGGGENKKEDKMDKLIAKLDKFTTAVINQQVVLKLDGTKVAESARLSTVTTGQR